MMNTIYNYIKDDTMNNNNIDEVYSKLNRLIGEKKKRIMNLLPSTHLVKDGIIIRFFNGWESGENNIKIHDIFNHDDDSLKSYLFYMPKGSMFDIKQHQYSESIVCLDGELELYIENQRYHMLDYSKKSIDINLDHQVKALKNSYVLVTKSEN